MKEALTEGAQSAAPESAPRAPAATEAPVQADRILALQRTAGNRAVTRMLGAPHAMLARDTETVNEWVKEETDTSENVTWYATYDVEFDSKRKVCWAYIKVKLRPDSDVTADDVTYTKIGVLSRFSLLWDSKFTFEQKNSWYESDDTWLFRPGIKFVDSGEHLTVNLHSGKGGPGAGSNRTNWYLMKPEYNEDKSKEIPVGYAELEHAHEISHQMGLIDEYENAHVKDRKVYKDNSLLGDYANEGFRDATVKLRHGERVAAVIGKATGRKLTARWT